MIVVLEIDPFAGTDIGKKTITLLSLSSNVFDGLPCKCACIVRRSGTSGADALVLFMDADREGMLGFRFLQQIDHVGHVVGHRNLAGLNRARTKLAPSFMLIVRPD